MRWLRSHPFWAVVIVLGGTSLGVSATVLIEVVGAFREVAVEEYDPERAAERLASRPPAAPPAPGGDVVSDPLERDLQARARTAAAAARERRIGEVAEAVGEPVPDDMFTSVLLVGTDASGVLADVVVDVLFPADGSPPLVASLPRDLYIPNPCKGVFTKLNESLGGCRGAASGSENLALAVEGFTGIRVDHYARVGFDGFAAVVDGLGGVTVCVGELAVRDAKSGLDLGPGCHDVDGYTALAWVRSRTPEYLVDGVWTTRGGSDFDRQRKEQEVLAQLARRLSSYSSLAGLTRALDAIAAAVRTDSGWSIGEAAALGFRYRSVDLADVARLAVPTRSVRTARGQAALVPTARFTDVPAAAVP